MVRVCRSARLRPAAYQFYRAILLSFAQHGEAPEPAALAQLAARFGVPLAATLARMAAQDLMQRDPAMGHIRAAYPFSGVPTAHRVTLLADERADRSMARDPAEVRVFAMCALDALGIPLMLRRDAVIVSADALTGEPVRVVVRRPLARDAAMDDRNAALAIADWQVEWSPVETVVYARPEGHESEHDTGRCIAEGTCCPLTNFFASPAHANAWAAHHRTAVSLDGRLLNQGEALARAQALFGGVLDRLAL
jgi:hypothetical protein